MGNAVPNKKWGVTQDAFDKFLARLDTDRERAGLHYEKIRRKLINFFECRDCSLVEDRADETINRVIRKIAEGETIRDPHTYVYGVARMLLLEVSKEREKQRASFEHLPTRYAAEELDESPRQVECLRQCLQTLPAESRKLITGYYQGERRAKIHNRKKLADALELPLNALRIRAHRLRDKLRSCVDRCVNQGRMN